MTDEPKAPSESAAERLTKEYRNSPAERLRREYEGSAVAQLARDYANSPTEKGSREMALALRLERADAAAEAAKLFANLKGTGIDQSIAASLGQIQSMQINPGIVKALTEFKPIGIGLQFMKLLTGVRPIDFDTSIFEAVGRLKPIEIGSNLANAIAEAQKVLVNFVKPYGGITEAVRAIEEQQRSFQAMLVKTLSGVVGDASRVNQWALALGKVDMPDIASLYPSASSIVAEVAQMHAAVRAHLTGLVGYNQAEMSAILGLNHRFDATLEATSLKMSVFAGVTDVVGSASPAWTEAYQSLFGEWHTRPDLPDAYWKDRRARRRMYDAADVDPGLAGAGLGIAVEVMVESGLATGARSEASAVAVIRLGDVSMTIRSRGTRTDAYRLLSRFEEKLRAYITRKLSERFGREWFKDRVDGNTAGNVKGRRTKALKCGEANLPLINYTELGDLANIVKSKKNWGEVFEPVFINAAKFDQDMQTLIAGRRPTVHTRPLDGLRLVEMVCVIDRLSKQMADDGAWKQLAESAE